MFQNMNHQPHWPHCPHYCADSFDHEIHATIPSCVSPTWITVSVTVLSKQWVAATTMCNVAWPRG